MSATIGLLPDGVEYLAVGASGHRWALLEGNGLVRINPFTLGWDQIDAGINIVSLDVNPSGIAFAIADDGNLYSWQESAQQFVQQTSGLDLAQVKVSAETLWVLDQDGVLALWDDDVGQFVDTRDDVAHFTVAKQDDEVFVVTSSNALLRYNYSTGEWDTLAADSGLRNIRSLSSTANGELWAVANGAENPIRGRVYQLSLSNQGNEDPTEAAFVSQTSNLGLDVVSVDQAAIDETGVLYALSGGEVDHLATQDVAIQTTIGAKTDGTVLATDNNGVLHLVYTKDGSVLHSYFDQGDWVQARAIPNSGVASEIKVDIDGGNNVFVSWIGSVGDQAEVYLSKGVPNDGYQGWTFSDAEQITDNDVSESSLDMEVLRDGTVHLTVASDKRADRHDDADVYHHVVEADRVFHHPEAPPGDASPTQELAAHPFSSLLDDDADGAWWTSIELAPGTGGIGYKKDFFNKAIEIKATAGAFWDYSKENSFSPPIGELSAQLDGQVTISVLDLAAKFKGGKNANNTLPFEMKISALGRTDTVYDEDLEKRVVEFFGGWGVELDWDIYKTPEQSTDEAFRQFADKVAGAFNWKVTLFAELDALYAIQTLQDLVNDPAVSGAGGTPFPESPLTFEAANGGPLTQATPPQDARGVLNLLQTPIYMLGSAFAGIGSQTEAAAGGAPDVSSSARVFAQSLNVIGGVTAELAWNPEQLLDGLNYNTSQPVWITKGLSWSLTGTAAANLGWKNGVLDAIKANVAAEFQLGWFYFKFLDLAVTIYKNGNAEDLAAYLANVHDYNVGGSTDVLDQGNLIFEGDGVGSDILDTTDFSFVVRDAGGQESRAYGAYVRELADQSDGAMNSIHTIEGIVDPDTGEITWLPDTAALLEGSEGLNTAPEIALRGAEGSEDGLVLVWGQVPAGNANLAAAVDVPPGNAYFVFGGDDKAGTTQLLTALSTDPFDAENGVNLTNQQKLYSIGASAALLGDLNSRNGAAQDMVFSAPDAEREAGKAYVIFDEKFFEVTDIDALNGVDGFTILGLTDNELGFATASAGDFDGDGYADVALSAPGAFNHQGAVYVLYGGQEWRPDGRPVAELFVSDDGQDIVDADDGALRSTVIAGETPGGRFGVALSGGHDLTGDGESDLAIGSTSDESVTIASLTDDTIKIVISADASASSDPDDLGLSKLGVSAAMVEDINGDDVPDLLMGSNSGIAYAVLGGERFDDYGRNYVVTWAPDDLYDLVVTFNGAAGTPDGILSSSRDEITYLRLEIFEAGEKLADFVFDDAKELAALDFNYDTGTGRVLANTAGGATAVSAEEYGLFISSDGADPDADAFWSVVSEDAGGDDEGIKLIGDAETVASSGELSSNVFVKASAPGIFDLDFLEALPQTGFRIGADTALPLQVSSAGDFNADGIADILAGYDASTDADGGDVPGRSFVVYGSDGLTGQSGTFDLEELADGEGVTVELPGGQVSRIGRFNSDEYDDIIVSSPAYSPDADGADGGQNGISYVVLGGPDGPTGDPYTLTDDTALQRSGTALAPAGDVDGDGLDDVLVGAPNAPALAPVIDAQKEARLVFSERDFESETGGAIVADEPAWREVLEINGGKRGEIPSAFANTSLGNLAVWVDLETDGASAGTYTIRSSIYNGASWSDPTTSRSIIAETRSVVDSVAITEGDSGPMVVWVERNLSQSDTTTVYSNSWIRGNPGRWSREPEVVDPFLARTPPQQPPDTEETLVDDGDLITVEPVAAGEGDGSARFVIERSGDLSKASGVYTYAIADLSAARGLDYFADHSGEFSFAAGQSRHEIEVRIAADDVYEGFSEDLLLRVSSSNEDAFVQRGGFAVAGADTISAIMTIDDESKVLNLASVDSGFQVKASPNGALGAAISTAGDLNADGESDFIVAAPAADGTTTAAGRAFVLYGSEGVAIADQLLDLDDLDDPDVGVQLLGTLEGGNAGSALAHGRYVSGSKSSPILAIGAPGHAADPDNGLPGQEGRVYLVDAGSQVVGKSALELSDATTAVLQADGIASAVGFGQSVAFGDIDGLGGDNDLIVSAPDRVYVVYDILTGPEIGPLDFDDYTVTTIENGAGSGFSEGLVVGDFDGDGIDDIIVGSRRGNPLLDRFDIERDQGGFVTVVRGTEGGLGATTIDVNDPGEAGFRLLGQAQFAPEQDSQSSADQDNFPTRDSRAGFPLVDAVGGALALVDINGDGARDLAIGAPRATLPDADNAYSATKTNVGRVYVLFGGRQWQAFDDEQYALTDLYGDRFRDGLVFEGSVTQGLLGSSLSNVGYFRGRTDANDDFKVEDLAIGAPGSEAGAGSAYIAFGSTDSKFTGITRKTKNIFTVDPTADKKTSQILPVFALEGIAEELTEADPNNLGAVGAAVAGLGNITSSSFDGTDGTDLGLGAPYVEVDGEARAYVATGHSWIKPFTSLEVKDLRSDNGFVNDFGGRIVASGDFDRDGYGDFVTITTEDELILTKGASIYDIETSTNRQVTLETPGGLLSLDSVAVGDFDGDGTAEAIAALKGTQNQSVTHVFDLDDLSEASIAPSDGPLLITGITGASAVNYYAADFNGDGFDDMALEALVFTPITGQFTVLNVFYLSRANGTTQFNQFRPATETIEWMLNPIAGLGDIDGDGRDEIIGYTPTDKEGATVRELVIGGYTDEGFVEKGTVSLEELFEGTPFSNNVGNVYAPSGVGDVNGDGFKDSVISVVAPDARGGNSSATILLYGQKDLSQTTATLIYSATTDRLETNGHDLEPYRFKHADILGDLNEDGLDDIIVGATGTKDSYVIYGSDDLPVEIVLPVPGEAADFELGFGIQGVGISLTAGDSDALTDPNRSFVVGRGDDLNGDGLGDFVISDRSFDATTGGQVGLTYGVYGERTSDAGTSYIDGTPEDDYILQPAGDGDASIEKVRVLAREGDDFIRMRRDTQVLVDAGAGDDVIGIAQVDSSRILRIDGGSGRDVLFLDNSTGGFSNNLDLTTLRYRLSGIEVVDLGKSNALTFDGPAIASLTDGNAPLIVNGVDSVAQAVKSNLGFWTEVGESAFEGAVYRIFQFTQDVGSNRPTNTQVWINRDDVSWVDLSFGSDGRDRLKGDASDNEIRALAGDDVVDGRRGKDVLKGGRGDDTLRGGPGSDELLGARGDDVLKGQAGNDLLRGGMGADLLVGGAGSDLLVGGSGDDELRGGPGADRLVGGPGIDVVRGSAEELAGDFVRGFYAGDAIRFVDFASEIAVDFVRDGTARLRFDASGDGALDGSLIVKGGVGLQDRIEFAREQGDTTVRIATLDGLDPDNGIRLNLSEDGLGLI